MLHKDTRTHGDENMENVNKKAFSHLPTFVHIFVVGGTKRKATAFKGHNGKLKGIVLKYKLNGKVITEQ